MQSVQSPRLRRLGLILTLICIGLYSISLFLLPFRIDSDNEKPWPIGLWCLLFDWLSIGDGAGFTWFANPLIFLSWILLRRRTRVSLWLSIGAMLLSISFMFIDEVVTGESGSLEKILSRGAGYYFWLGSIVATTSGCIYPVILKSKQPFIHPHELDR